MRADFLEFKKYYKDTITKVPSDSFFKHSIDNKFKHSIDVLHTGIRIMAETPELNFVSENFQTLSKRALLFHDVGRFEEAVKRYHTPNLTADTETLSQYDHGLLGYQTLKSNPTYNDIRILLAIKYHGKMMEEVKASSLWEEAQNGEHKKEAEQILYLVRDADKLANL